MASRVVLFPLISIFALALLIQGCAAPVEAQSGAVLGRIQTWSGTLQIQDSARSRPVQVSASDRSYRSQSFILRDGMIISTAGGNSRAVVQLNGRSGRDAVVTLHGNSVLRVNRNSYAQLAQASPNDGSMALLRGSASVNSRANGLTVDTVSVAAGVRGTKFTVTVGADGSTDVAVIEGSVETRNAAGTMAQAIQAGQRASVGFNVESNVSVAAVRDQHVEETVSVRVRVGAGIETRTLPVIQRTNEERERLADAQARVDSAPVSVATGYGDRSEEVQAEAGQVQEFTNAIYSGIRSAEEAEDPGFVMTRAQLERDRITVRNRNDANLVLAEETGRRHTQDAVQTQVQRVRQSWATTWEVENALDQFIVDWSREIDAFIEQNEVEFEEFIDTAGGW